MLLFHQRERRKKTREKRSRGEGDWVAMGSDEEIDGSFINKLGYCRVLLLTFNLVKVKVHGKLSRLGHFKKAGKKLVFFTILRQNHFHQK
jgi:hypothetical protein